MLHSFFVPSNKTMALRFRPHQNHPQCNATELPIDERSKLRRRHRYFRTNQYYCRFFVSTCTIFGLCLFILSLISGNLQKLVVSVQTNISLYPQPSRSIRKTPRVLRWDWYDGNVWSLVAERKNIQYNISYEIIYPMTTNESLASLQNSEDYDDQAGEVFETKSCKAQYAWQTQSFPTCNFLHEFDLSRLFDVKGHDVSKVVASGYWRDVWLVNESNGKVILKTIRYEHDQIPRNFDRHRRDALAMEHLTKSKFVLDIYGYCANSGLSEFGEGGDIDNAIWPRYRNKKGKLRYRENNMTSLEKLQIATNAIIALAEVHNFDKEGVASIAHTDIAPGQFVRVGRRYKLNDFNRVRFIRWNVEKNRPCTYYVGNNPGKNRSPEEYDYQPQTEKVDIYSFGNILYMLLQGVWPFEDLDEKEAAQKVINGERPAIYVDVWNSTDPLIQTLKEAMILCHQQDPKERASAREIEKMLRGKLEEVDPGRVDYWLSDIS